MCKLITPILLATLLIGCGGGGSDTSATKSPSLPDINNPGKLPKDHIHEQATFSPEDAADNGEDIDQYIRAPSMIDKNGKAIKIIKILGNHYGNYNQSVFDTPVELYDAESGITAINDKGSLLEIALFDKMYGITTYQENLPDDFQMSSGNLVDTSSKSYQMYKGQREAELLQFSCLGAMTLGQQEQLMDTQDFANFLAKLSSNKKCPTTTQVLAVNLDNSRLTDLASKGVEVKPYLTQEGSWGQTIAWIGVAYNEDINKTTTQIQKTIDELTSKKIKYIGLISAMGKQADISIVQSLSDVDVVLGRIDESSIENSFNKIDANLVNNFKLETTNGDAQKVCLTYNTDRIVSKNNFSYDANIEGNILKCDQSNLYTYLVSPYSEDENRIQSNKLSGYWKDYLELIDNLNHDLDDEKNIYLFNGDIRNSDPLINTINQKYPL